jgi:hypothetical protein
MLTEVVGVSAESLSRAVDHLVTSGGQVPMAYRAAASGVALRARQRRFELAVGLTAKQFAQLRRARAMRRHTIDEALNERVVGCGGRSGLCGSGAPGA